MGCCLCKCLIRKVAGEWEDCTQSFIENSGLSVDARKMVNDAFDGLDVTKIVDVHVHLIGIHTEESGCYVHENLDNCCRCMSYSKKYIILQAAGVDIDPIPDSDKPYYQRLIQLYENYIPKHIQNKVKQDIKEQIKNNKNKSQPLMINDNNEEKQEQEEDEEEEEEEEEKDMASSTDLSVQLLSNTKNDYGALNEEDLLDRAICPRVVLLGLDQVYNTETGIAEPQNTSVYTPETYVEQIVNENKHIFIMGVSINPYRKDCIDKLIEYKNKGCNVIKWLPNSMGIDPMDKRCDIFYDKLVELDMFLLTHTGHEHSLDDADYTVQEYGNPLRYRRALDKGVKIIMAHCASEGSDDDLDEDKKDNNNECNKCDACDLFIRMMREERYKNLLYGDISAMTAFKRIGNLQKIIQCEDIHDRLMYGSDYPVPAINGIVWYGRLVSNGLISNEDANILREIFKYNPVLADFISKRIMRYTDDNGKVHQFSDIIFQQFPLLCNNLGVNLNVKQKKNQ